MDHILRKDTRKTMVHINKIHRALGIWNGCRVDVELELLPVAKNYSRIYNTVDFGV